MAERILIADDEEKLCAMVADYLRASGFETIEAHDGVSTLELARGQPFDCLILDVNMPGLDGFSVARELRRFSNMPIIFLTAVAEETDRIVGLELGADDYLVKPFSPRELLARLRAVLRRTVARPQSQAEAEPEPSASKTIQASPGSALELSLGALRIDKRRRRVVVDGKTCELSSLQFDILLILAQEPGRVFERATLLKLATGSDLGAYERTMDAHMKNIRKALRDDADKPRFIGTVRGVGYRFIEQTDEA